SYGPDICTDFLIDFIKKNKEQPFFAYYPMLLVHDPFLPTPDSKNKKGKDKSQNYRDMVNYMDKCVGRILDALEESDLRENTIVLFTTDNGTGRGLKYPYKGEQRKGEKAYPTDGGSHAPLIVNCPGIVSQGFITDDLVDFSDFMPTLADITIQNSRPPPRSTAGANPILSGHKTSTTNSTLMVNLSKPRIGTKR
ncbi:MAG: sulfatase-like hydrolase/transferase, partial [Planctomycetota bacterium]